MQNIDEITPPYVTSRILTLINAGGGRNHPPPPENRVFSATEHRMNP